MGRQKITAILPLFDSYFKSSKVLQKEITAMEIPDGAQLFTANAVSMYTNIPTNKALSDITQFLCCCQRHNIIETQYAALIEGLGIIMQR